MEGKVALITGSAKRVGACIAKTLHQQGMKVVIHYRGSQQAAEALVSALNEKRPDSAACLQADLNKLEEIKTLAAQSVKVWGRLDALVNNASAFYSKPFSEVTETDWEDLFASNAKAPFFLSQALAVHLQETQGNIVNMVDVHADRPLKGFSVYCMAKAALVSLTKSLAQDLAPAVRVNAVAPGMILWPDENAIPEKTEKYLLNRIALKRFGEPSDIAEAISFLLQQGYMTGHILNVDGGRSLIV